MRIVFDLDGTLADGTHREHFITGETKDWDAYFAACDGDRALPGLLALHALYYAPNHNAHTARSARAHRIEIWSGRGEGPGGVNHEKTRRWLLDRVHVGIWDEPRAEFFNVSSFHENRIAIRMRGHGDHTPDHELKRRWLIEASEAGAPPELVFDDRNRVVAMWRDEGIPCFQVAPGDF